MVEVASDFSTSRRRVNHMEVLQAVLSDLSDHTRQSEFQAVSGIVTAEAKKLKPTSFNPQTFCKNAGVALSKQFESARLRVSEGNLTCVFGGRSCESLELPFTAVSVQVTGDLFNADVLQYHVPNKNRKIGANVTHLLVDGASSVEMNGYLQRRTMIPITHNRDVLKSQSQAAHESFLKLIKQYGRPIKTISVNNTLHALCSPVGSSANVVTFCQNIY